jgi:penicillin-insensitive murein endopeptidase
LRAAAQEPEVARIFVGWVIKRELCRTVKGDRSWLRKIRPWWGHTRHFHIRLHCPDGSSECRDQRAIAPGDGCGQEAWFSKAAVAKRKKKGTKKKKTPYKPLPARCLALLK